MCPTLETSPLVDEVGIEMSAMVRCRGTQFGVYTLRRRADADDDHDFVKVRAALEPGGSVPYRPPDPPAVRSGTVVTNAMKPARPRRPVECSVLRQLMKRRRAGIAQGTVGSAMLETD